MGKSETERERIPEYYLNNNNNKQKQINCIKVIKDVILRNKNLFWGSF